MDHGKSADIRIVIVVEKWKIELEDTVALKFSSCVTYLHCMKCFSCANYSDLNDSTKCSNGTSCLAIMNRTDDTNCSANRNNENVIVSTNGIFGGDDEYCFPDSGGVGGVDDTNGAANSSG